MQRRPLDLLELILGKEAKLHCPVGHLVCAHNRSLRPPGPNAMLCYFSSAFALSTALAASGA